MQKWGQLHASMAVALIAQSADGAVWPADTASRATVIRKIALRMGFRPPFRAEIMYPNVFFGNGKLCGKGCFVRYWWGSKVSGTTNVDLLLAGTNFQSLMAFIADWPRMGLPPSNSVLSTAPFGRTTTCIRTTPP